MTAPCNQRIRTGRALEVCTAEAPLVHADYPRLRFCVGHAPAGSREAAPSQQVATSPREGAEQLVLGGLGR